MTQQEIKTFRERVAAFIDKRRLRDAINEIKELATRRLAWEIEDKIKQTEQNYAYMLRYLTEGAPDPDRQDVYDGLVAEVYGLLDSMISYMESAESPTLYYNKLRYEKKFPTVDKLGKLIAEYSDLSDRLSLFSLVTDTSNPDNEKSNRQKLEQVQADIFNYIWTKPLLNSEEKGQIMDLLSNEGMSTGVKQHVVSAVTLGLMQQYDRNKLEILISTYLSEAPMAVTSAALVGMLFGMWKYRNRPLTRRITDRLMTAKDKETWTSDLRTAFIEMIRARDTERINKKMREEVMPRMSKLRPDMLDKMRKTDINPLDAASLQENPEWQEMLDKSGVTDQLKEMMEIQMEGGDVMMSTFSHLKNFPFFSDISNWFLPFDRNHSAVVESMNELDIMGDMMENARMLCDSDKYSFMIMLKTVPASQKEMMVGQIKGQSEAIYETMNSTMTAQQDRRQTVNSYMQNIYRFYKLFGRRTEFYDPFDSGLNLISVAALADDFSDTEMLRVVAEFYFKLNYMKEALDVYNHLERLEAGDASRYQKMGYCYERLRDYDKAIEYYQKAELLDTSSAWTARRLATCYRLLGNHKEAMKYYKQLSEMLPEDLGAAMLYGQSLLENGEYGEALHEFYKVEYLDEKSTKAWRPLAWTLFLTGDMEGASRYYKKIVLDDPNANDYLNMGHVALATGNMREAVNNYTMAVKQMQGDTEWLIKALTDDEPALLQAGVDTRVLPLIADATLYQLS